MLFRLALAIIVSSIFFACNTGIKTTVPSFNPIAEKYVRLGLTIGQYDGDFVDAYYGPDSLKPALPDSGSVFPKDSLLQAITILSKEIEAYANENGVDSMIIIRTNWMQQQLVAFSRRIKIFSGEFATFDEEARDLFGVTPPSYNENHFKNIIAELDSLLPGTGTLQNRFEQITKQYIIPKNKVDTVFKTAIAEAANRTSKHISLPANETFTLEYVTQKPWSGYNWYKGNYNSLIQINTDLPLYIERAIDLACHEGYPGHHVYNMLLEKNLYRDKGWVEMSLYPLFSPQSLIAEGSANFGIAVAFPGTEQIHFAKQTLMPLAGMDTTNATAYFKALELKGKLNYARNEAARGFLDGTMDEKEALRWLTSYGLYTNDAATKSLQFAKKYRSYVINYNYGQDLVKSYIENNGGTIGNPTKRWELFSWLLSNPVLPSDLKSKK